jgi:hypothetical protein
MNITTDNLTKPNMMPTTDDLDQQTFPMLLYTNYENKNQTNNTGATKLEALQYENHKN